MATLENEEEDSNVGNEGKYNVGNEGKDCNVGNKEKDDNVGNKGDDTSDGAIRFSKTTGAAPTTTLLSTKRRKMSN